MSANQPGNQTPATSSTASTAPARPQGKELWLRRITAVVVLLMAVVVYAVPRLSIASGDDFWTNLQPVSLQAAILIATFAVFSTAVQGNRPFFIGVAGVLIPLVILYVFALPAAAVGQSAPEWADLMAGLVSLALLGLSVLGPGEQNIFK